MRARAQTSVELLIILAVSLVLVALVINFTVDRLNEVQRTHDVKVAQQSMDELVLSINRTFAQGPGTVNQVTVTWPKGIVNSTATISGSSIQVRVYDTDVAGTAIPGLTGTVSTTPGPHTVRMTASDTNVTLSSGLLTASVSSVYLPLSRDSNGVAHITISNLSTNAATLALSLSWSPTAVTTALSSTSGSISGNGTFAFDLNAAASAGSLGNYVGSITVLATYSGSTESLVIPVNVEVFPSNSALLTSVPAALSLSNFQTDTNSVTFQVCNGGNTTLSTISFTTSTGNAGDWFQGISTISSLAANSCTSKSLTVIPTIPVGDTMIAPGYYYGSILMKDYSGANSTVIPVTVQILGMSDFFSWDWTPASKTATTVSGFGLHNHGTTTITATDMTISKWNTCDRNHSSLTQIVIDGNSLFSGTSADGADSNITDVSMSAGTVWTNNTLTFNGTINDDNEQFVAAVDFTDGSSYTSAVYGNGCVADVTAPGRVTDLTAYPGPEPESIILRWTYPGDDNMTGSATQAILKYSWDNVSTDPTFTDANSLTISSIYPGGTPGSLYVTGLKPGYLYYFAMTFLDEADNNGGISNLATQKPWNRYEYSLSDFNAGQWVHSILSEGDLYVGDANFFRISNLVTGAGRDRNIVVRVQDDVNRDKAWVAYLNFDASNLKKIKVWFPVPDGAIGIPSTTPQFDGNYTQAIASWISLMDGNLITGGYGYGGDSVYIPDSTHAYIDIFTGFTDMNIAIDLAAGHSQAGGQGGVP